MNREITIAGGGLAGLSLGISLRQQGVPVTVLEAGTYPRHRVCGEFISGVSSETLAALGITTAFEGALEHRSLAWFDRGRQMHCDRLTQPALGISRHRLDERLARLAEDAGVVLRTGVRARPEPREGLVWAAGRRPRKGRWIGLKAHVRHPHAAADLEMHAGTCGYAGLAGIEDGWTNVCGLFLIDRSIQAKGSALLPAYLAAGGNTALARSLEQAEWREGSFAAVAGFELGKQPASLGGVALGDAESMIAPFTGNGMSMAFQAAEQASAPLAAWSRGERCWPETAARIRQSLSRHFRRRLWVSSLVHPLLLSGAGRALLHGLASHHLLPFQPVLTLLR